MKKPVTKRRASTPAPSRMLDLITGYWISQLVFVAAKLGIADQLRKGPRRVEELARAVGADPAALHRTLRALASVGVFAERGSGRFALTPLGATLRSDRPDSMLSFSLMMTEGYNWDVWRELLTCVRTGEAGFEKVHGLKVFDYLAAHADDSRVFSDSMRSISGTENPAVAAACDLRGIGTLVDVGGSLGHLLATILRKQRRLKGVLFDLPRVIAQARQAPYVTDPAVAGRVTLAEGDIFQAVPSGADAYLMKYILHDWNDGECIRILGNCRDAMAPGGRVLVVDSVIEPGNRPQWGKRLDINMLVLTGGRERTRQEFAGLFRESGLRLTRVIRTSCPLSIVEAVRA